MSKFKRGDLVKVVSHSATEGTHGLVKSLLPVGGTGFVTRVLDEDVKIGEYSYHPDDLEQFTLLEVVEGGNKPIESDGGSSSYYFTELPKWLIDRIVDTGGIEIKDIVQFVFDNDAHAKDIIKAQKRIIEERKGGGKAGLKPLYDYNKIIFFAQDQSDVATANLHEFGTTSTNTVNKQLQQDS